MSVLILLSEKGWIATLCSTPIDSHLYLSLLSVRKGLNQDSGSSKKVTKLAVSSTPSVRNKDSKVHEGPHTKLIYMAVYNRWTGLVDWTSGLD